jgi:hypothetical protein
VVLGFELIALLLLGRHSTAWATPPVPFLVNSLKGSFTFSRIILSETKHITWTEVHDFLGLFRKLRFNSATCWGVRLLYLNWKTTWQGSSLLL